MLRKIIGIILIIIGVISGFIPIIQGWLFIVAGLLILGVKRETIKEWADKSKKWIKRLKF
ncbi:hypothetical protein HYT53_00670 [Candidatus Woesearchaeota archaeon]|nr:hypothetical protein [Candidatus Woesearchaeota archaeon]